MKQIILNFITAERVCALTTLLPDGTPHAAAMHFSHTTQPLTLLFSADKSQRKCLGLSLSNSIKAAVVIGFSEETWQTLQLSGTVRLVTKKSDITQIKQIHYRKHPDSQKFESEPGTVFLQFTPAWWRFSDLSADPAKILSSDQTT